MHLKEKDFQIDDLHVANLNGLSDYIRQGQKSDEVQVEEGNTFVPNYR